MNHLASLNMKLKKMESEDNFLESEQETAPTINPEEKITSQEKLERLQRSAPVRKIYPNSNVTLLCLKEKIHYFAVPYEGYCFPMVVNFNMKVLVKVYISFIYPRPNYIDNELEFNSFVFQIRKPPEPIESYQKKFVYMCIMPQCDFKTNLSVKFDSRDFRVKEDSAPAPGPRNFAINYKDYLAFSDDFNKNLQNVRQFFKKKDYSKVIFNKEVAKNFSERKKRQMRELAQIDTVRCSQARMKSQIIEGDRVNQIMERKHLREQEIIKKRLVVEYILEELSFRTFQRTYIIHHYLIKVMEAMNDRYSKLKRQKQSALVKIGASARIVKFFCQVKNSVVKEQTILTTVKGKKDKVFEIKLQDALLTFQALHLFGKINRISSYEKALDVAGTLFKKCAKGALLNHLAVTMKARVIRAQKSFRYTIDYRRTCIQIYSKLFGEIIKEIDDLGQKYSCSKLRIAGILDQKEITEVVTYLFEHYLFRFIMKKFRMISSSKFPTLNDHLHSRPWGPAADASLDSKKMILHRYPHCVNGHRLRQLRTEFGAHQPTLMIFKNRTRDEQIKKLKSIFGFVQESFKMDKFSFDFDDVDVKLFILNYFHIDSTGSDINVEDLLFGTEYKDVEKSMEGGSSSLLF